MTVRKSWLRFTCEKALGVSQKTIIENNRVNKEPIYDSQKVMAAFHMRKIALGVSQKTIIENNRVNKEPIYDSQKVMAAFHMRKSLGCVTENNNWEQ